METVKMLDELLADESDKLTDWEIGFIDSLNKQRNWKWTEAQCLALSKIWDKVFA